MRHVHGGPGPQQVGHDFLFHCCEGLVETCAFFGQESESVEVFSEFVDVFAGIGRIIVVGSDDCIRGICNHPAENFFGFSVG